MENKQLHQENLTALDDISDGWVKLVDTMQAQQVALQAENVLLRSMLELCEAKFAKLRSQHANV
jgi:hypothetical protein